MTKNDLTSSYASEYLDEEPMFRFFAYDHLPAPLRDVSGLFAILARRLITDLPRSPERTVALRKLLESKDAAVRCAVDEMKKEARS